MFFGRVTRLAVRRLAVERRKITPPTALQEAKDDVMRVEATRMGSDLMYQGEMAENWEELLAEARASYPERAGPRKAKHLKREKLRWKQIRLQHKIAKNQRIEKHHKDMLDYRQRAIERKGWLGPVLKS